ncbi:MAG: stage II sporulation protein R [Bacilli bacterium]|nr:stage II sporulation protein R [Bacilli bacterium]
MKKLAIMIILAGIVVIVSNSNEYVEIPASSIRMRVIAGSNSEEDQSQKKLIKSWLEEKLYELIAGEKDEEKIDDIIKENKEEIDNSIKSKMAEAKINSSYSSNFGYNYFPEKEFKGLVYKAGNYKSFVVTLDQGKGDNWWCVLYPPLCLIDEDKDDYEYHFLIKDALNKYN